MIRLRSLLQHQGHALLVGGAVALICLALTWEHTTPSADHMAADGDELGAVIATCLAVVTTGLGLLGAVRGVIARRRRRPPQRLAPALPLGISQPLLPGPVAARAGPAVLQVFLR